MGLLDFFQQRPQATPGINGALARYAQAQPQQPQQSFLSRLSTLGDELQQANNPIWARSSSQNQLPAAIQEDMYFQQLDPVAQERYLRIKRAQQNIDAGGQYYAIDPRTGQPVPLLNKTLPPQNQPANVGAAEAAKQAAQVNAAGDKAAATARGSALGTAEGAQDKKAINAPDIINLVRQARELLPNATNGGLQSLVKSGAQFVGKSTGASKTDKQLKIIGSSLVNYVPRFEGPQSDYDVQTYRETAGDVANESIPVEDRMAALDTIESLQKKYTGSQAQGSAPGAKSKAAELLARRRQGL